MQTWAYISRSTPRWFPAGLLRNKQLVAFTAGDPIRAGTCHRILDRAHSPMALRFGPFSST